VLDFDGTLVDSNAVKRLAYYDIFRPEDRPHVDAVLQELRVANRFAKIGEILRRAGAQGRPGVEHFADAYNRICEAHQATCAERPGAGEVLARLARRRPLYLWSGTLQEPLRRVAAQRGWSGYFRAVLGSPEAKAANLARILADSGVTPGNVLVVGDTNEDLESARACGCAFAGIASDATDFDIHGVRMIAGLAELETLC
jgi:phosphoglycolate phosphatase